MQIYTKYEKDYKRACFKFQQVRKEFEEGFVKDCEQYNNARLFVACGQGVYDELMK